MPKELIHYILSLDEKPGSRFRTQYKNLNLSFVKNNENEFIVEFTKSNDHFQSSEDFFLEINQFDVPKNENELIKLRENLVLIVSSLSGFQRVMYYTFFEDGDGEVLTEKKDTSVYGSYLGLRFPASDIPMIARKLYLINPWRQIPDVNAKPISLFGISSKTPDLSYSDLRSVADVHIAYLRNMEVASSVSFPISISGELKGLVSCHHFEPKNLSVAILEKISAYIKSYNFAYRGYLAQQKIQNLDSLKFKIETAKKIIKNDFSNIIHWLIHEFSADGITIIINNEENSFGLTVEYQELRIIDDWFLEKKKTTVIVENLSEELQSQILTEIAGFIAIKIDSKTHGDLRIYIYRKEFIYEVEWAGNPQKPKEHSLYGIAPRHSFEKWVEKKMGSCRPWNQMEKLLALQLAKNI